jgi:galactokinase
VLESSSRIDALRKDFEDRFGLAPALIVEAPGRVNLIGEHTDYHEGLVLPVAIDRTLLLAAHPAKHIFAWSCELNAGGSIEDAEAKGDPWLGYIVGVYHAFQQRGLVPPPVRMMVQSDIPIGAGLSSSAALTVSMTVVLLVLMAVNLSPIDIALIAQAAEHFVGAPVGIMDQLTVTAATDGALRIDCRSLQFTPVPIPPDLALVVFDSGVERALSRSAYAQRRAEAERGLEILRHYGLTARTLRDVTISDLEYARATMDDITFRRCRHVITENGRVDAMVEALHADDRVAMGRLMAASHESLRWDYEVSCPELDLLVELGNKAPGAVGSRLTGAGFGGCTVHLVIREQVDAFRTFVSNGFAAAMGRVPRNWHLHPHRGVMRVG